jgi:hypothetical protein
VEQDQHAARPATATTLPQASPILLLLQTQHCAQNSSHRFHPADKMSYYELFLGLLPHLLQQAYNAVPLLRSLDSLLLGTAFSIIHTVLSSPPLQLLVLGGSLWLTGFK